MALLSFRRPSQPAGAATPRQADVLAVRVGQGDPAAFEALVKLLLPRLRAVAWRVLRDMAEAEDVAQETFLRLWQQAPKLNGVAVEPWVLRVGTNLALDCHRRHKPVLMEVLPDTLAKGDDGETAMRRAELGAEIDAAIDALPERQRLAMILVHLEQVSQKTAAEALGVSVDAL